MLFISVNPTIISWFQLAMQLHSLENLLKHYSQWASCACQLHGYFGSD